MLRPRTEPKSYAEAPDIVLLPAKINGRQQNGNIDSDTDDEEMPPIIAIKVNINIEIQVIFRVSPMCLVYSCNGIRYFSIGIVGGRNMGAR